MTVISIGTGLEGSHSKVDGLCRQPRNLPGAVIVIVERAREIARNDLGRVDDRAVIEVLAAMVAGLVPGVSSGFVRAIPETIPEMRLDDGRPL